MILYQVSIPWTRNSFNTTRDDLRKRYAPALQQLGGITIPHEGILASRLQSIICSGVHGIKAQI